MDRLRLKSFSGSAPIKLDKHVQDFSRTTGAAVVGAVPRSPTRQALVTREMYFDYEVWVSLWSFVQYLGELAAYHHSDTIRLLYEQLFLQHTKYWYYTDAIIVCAMYGLLLTVTD